MAYSNEPVFAQGLTTFQKTLTAAKTTRSGTGSATLLITAPAEGLWLTRIWARALDTLAADTRVDLYLSPDGAAATLVDAVLVQDYTYAATSDIAETPFAKWSKDVPLYLGPSEQLWAGLSAAFASGMLVCGQGQKFTMVAA